MMDIFPASEDSCPEDSKTGDDNKSGTGPDDNNNDGGRSKSEKYSLRPRGLRQKTEKGLELKKEILRSKRGPEGPRPKSKPPPLSKYRRKTANARERNRMREINVAFETLRRAVPHISGPLHSGNEKLTKITTLRLAMKYIQALRQVLEGTGTRPTVGHVSLADFITDDADLDAVLLSDGESLHFRSDMSSPDHPLTSPFSELSNCDNSSPSDFCDNPEFPFHDSVIGSDFRFEDDLPETSFCDDFLTNPCLGGFS